MVATAAANFYDYTDDLTSLAFCDVENTTAHWIRWQGRS